MANNKELNAADLLVNSGALQNGDPETNALQKALLSLQLQQLTEEVGEKTATKEARNQARKVIAKSMETARQQQEMRQESCPHKKPNGSPSIAGQRDHQHNYIFICAYCAKTYDQHTLPPHLRIPNEWIGGPE